MEKGTTVTRRLEFDAGHRVRDHEGKCATLHGHRYVVEVTAAGGLDALGRVVDFSVLKSRIGSWLDEYWDHTTVIWEKDAEVLAALRTLPRAKDPWAAPWNPTAENMSEHLLRDVCPRVLKGTGVTVTRVVVWETPNCRAETSL